MKKIIAYKYEIFPDAEQKIFLHNHFGVARWAYNFMLGQIKTEWEENETRLKPSDAVKRIRQLKKETQFDWLNDVSDRIFDFTQIHISSAFKHFFRRVKQGGEKAGYPKFKSKHHQQSFSIDSYKILIPVRQKENESLEKGNRGRVVHRVYKPKSQIGFIQLPKLKSQISFQCDRPFPKNSTPKTCTVSKSTTGKYFISFVLETDEIYPEPNQKNDIVIGIDRGVKYFLVLSDGQTFDMPSFKDNKRLATLQQRLSKKAKKQNLEGDFAGKNRRKARLKVAKFHEKVKNQREYFIHQVVNQILEKQPSVIVLEDLKVKNMTKRPKKIKSENGEHYEKNHATQKAGLNRAILEMSWTKFKEVLTYKAKEKGIKIVEVKPHYSSQRCNHCGHTSSDNRT